MALGMSREGFFIAPAKVQMTSKPMKLNRMMDRYVSAFVFVRSGRNVAGDMSPANPLLTAYQMPSPPTATAMSTLSTAPPFKIHAESDTFEKLMNTTIHTKASSMAKMTGRSNSTPNTIPRMSGNSVPRLAIHSGKLIQ